jgi:hypothetical protein
MVGSDLLDEAVGVLPADEHVDRVAERTRG